MKKQILFIAIVLTSCISKLHSQSLSNTTWAVNDTVNNLFLYFKFSSNMVSFSTDNTFYTNVSNYTVSANSFTILDLSTAPCPGDTGRYTFSQQGTTLSFTLIADVCSTRPSVFTKFHWVKLATGLPEPLEGRLISISPNPSSGEFRISGGNQGKAVILSQSGAIVKEVVFADSQDILVDDLAEGMYFLLSGGYRTRIVVLGK